MSEVDYSPDALNVLSLFHSAKFSVFVEGDDDEEFWAQILDMAEITGYHIESVGGKNQLQLKLDQILENNAQIIVAADRDYSDYLDEHVECLRLVKTYGHSIENSLYCKISLSRVISKLSRKRRNVSTLLDEWEGDFATKSLKLIKYDIANIKYSKGLTVLGDNCCKFLTSNNARFLSEQKINRHIDAIKGSFVGEEMQNIDDMIRLDQRELWYIGKGHFLTHASLNVVKHITKMISGKKVTLSTDSFYALVVDGCATCRIKCQATQQVIEQIRGAWMSLDINANI